jgi:cytochrome c oxidase subunit 3
MLLFSALTMEIARQQMYREFDVMEEWFGLGRPTVRHAAPWIVATLALGISFLAGQHTAWPHLRMQGVGAIHGPGSGWGASVFPVLVATHEVHLLLGALALVVILPVLLIVRHTEARQGIVNYAAYYWYGMVAAWSLLFGWMLLAR